MTIYFHPWPYWEPASPKATDEPDSFAEASPTSPTSPVSTAQGLPFLFPTNKSVPNDSTIYRASLRTGEMKGEEEFEFKGNRRRLRLSAFRLHWDGIVGDPPAEVGVLDV